MAAERIIAASAVSAMLAALFTSCSSSQVGNVNQSSSSAATTTPTVTSTEIPTEVTSAEIQTTTADAPPSTASVKGKIFSSDGKLLVYSDSDGTRIRLTITRSPLPTFSMKCRKVSTLPLTKS